MKNLNRSMWVGAVTLALMSTALSVRADEDANMHAGLVYGTQEPGEPLALGATIGYDDKKALDMNGHFKGSPQQGFSGGGEIDFHGELMSSGAKMYFSTGEQCGQLSLGVGKNFEIVDGASAGGDMQITGGVMSSDRIGLTEPVLGLQANVRAALAPWVRLEARGDAGLGIFPDRELKTSDITQDVVETDVNSSNYNQTVKKVIGQKLVDKSRKLNGDKNSLYLGCRIKAVSNLGPVRVSAQYEKAFSSRPVVEAGMNGKDKVEYQLKDRADRYGATVEVAF